MIAPLFALMLATAPAQPAPAPGGELAAVSAALAKEGFSAAGIKTLQARPAGLPEKLAAFRVRAATIGQELGAAKAANDAARFGAAMRAGDTLNAEIQQTRTEQMLRTLSALSPADRKIFLRHVGPPAQAPQTGR